MDYKSQIEHSDNTYGIDLSQLEIICPLIPVAVEVTHTLVEFEIMHRNKPNKPALIFLADSRPFEVLSRAGYTHDSANSGNGYQVYYTLDDYISTVYQETSIAAVLD